MTEYYKKPIKIESLTLDGIFSSQDIIRLELNLANRREKVIFDLRNVFFFSNSLSNLISLALFNNHEYFRIIKRRYCITKT